jgi:tRNA (mo5U34)-methyltransferase
MSELGIVRSDAVTARELLNASWQRAAASVPDWRTLMPLLGHNIADHGDSPAWLDSIDALPDARTDDVDVGATIRIGGAADLDASAREVLRRHLQALRPWRKGPFSLFGIHIDTEWRSDWKWSRVAPHLSALADRRVLDVGCGNGYYGWRMCEAGAQVIGIDPTIVYSMQYLAIAKYLAPARPTFDHALLPVRLEDMPGRQAFDTVLSMGVLYHRRDPAEHLRALRAHLRPGGELVLETLIVADGSTEVLIPSGRYARMRNVRHIPPRATLERWVGAAGFGSIRVVDVTATSVTEQRATAWMPFESLADALNPLDPQRTIEGHPAPVRCVLIAGK